MNGSEQLDQIAPALVAGLGKLKNPRPDGHGQVRGKSDYKYLTLPALCEHVRVAFDKVGLVFSQEVVSDSEGVGVVTRIMHLSGQWLEYGPLMLAVQGTAQEAGSALTYCRRYSLAAAVGLAADEDDDGKKASTRPEPGVRNTPSPRHGSGDGSGSQTSPGSAPQSSGSASEYEASPSEASGQADAPGALAGETPSTDPESVRGGGDGEGPTPSAHSHSFSAEPFEHDGKPFTPRKGWEVCTGCLDARKAAA